MNISDLQLQRNILSKTFTNAYNELFSTHLAKIQDESKDIVTKMNLSNEFYQTQKSLRNEYDAEKYKLETKESPSVHTMTSAINYKQKLLTEEMNERIEAESRKLKAKILSGKYNFLEELKFKNDFKKFQAELKVKLSNEIYNFRASYHEALVSRNSPKIDSLENSLLSNLLSKS